jgi:PAS domain S-box-containing protein
MKDGRELGLDELPAQRAARGEHVRDFEFSLVFDDGTIRHVLGYGAPLLDEQGRPRGAVHVLVDITERKAAEEALRQSRDGLEMRVQQRTAELAAATAYNRGLLECSPDPLVTIGPDGTITDVNTATEQAIGRTREQFIGTDFSAYFTDPEMARAGYQQVFREGSVHDYPLEILHTDGHVTAVLYNAAVYRDPRGDPVGVFAAARDITAQRKAEAALREINETMERRVATRTAELARSNEDLQHFAYIASHDIQEPLRMVSGFLKLLEERYRSQLDAKAQEYIGYSVEGATRMSQLIADLLAYSRVDQKGEQFRPVDAAVALGEALANLQGSIQEAGAQVTWDELPTVTADATQLMQVLQNLVGNAIKFRDPARPCQVHVAARRQDGRWTFSVRDNGIGVDPRHQDRIFVIFHRLHTRQKYPGTGVGLAICKRIVERHGGRIWVESKVGEGSTFYFTMPAGEAAGE